MGTIRDSADDAFRDFATDGDATSGAHQPVKAEIRALFGVIEDNTGSGYLGYPTEAARDADTSQSDGALAQVDGDSAIYRWDDAGNQWVDTGTTLATTDAVDQAVTDAEAAQAAAEAAQAAIEGESDQIDRNKVETWRVLPYNGVAYGTIDGNGYVSDGRYTDGSVIGSAAETNSVTDYAFDATTRLSYFNDPTEVYEIWPGFGQSNMQGVNPDADSDTQYYSTAPRASALMPSGGVRVEEDQVITSWVPALETSSGTLGETCLTSFADHYIDRIFSTTGKTPNMLVLDAGETAKATRELNRGTEWYTRLLQGVESATREVLSRAARPYCPGVLFVQGEREESFETTWDQYEAGIKRLARALDEDIRRITGQSEPVMFFMVATDGGVSRDPEDSDYDPAANAEAFFRLHGQDNIRVVGPHYFCEISSDGLHLSNKGQAQQGFMFAQAVSDELWGDGWNCVRPLRAEWVSSTAFDIIMAVPQGYGNLVNSAAEDVDGTFTNSVDGFDAYLPKSGTAATISSIAVADEPGSHPGVTRRVRVTLSADPTEPVRIYAGLRNDSATNGPVDGGRTLVRTSTAVAGNFASYNLYHWSLPFVFDCGYHS